MKPKHLALRATDAAFVLQLELPFTKPAPKPIVERAPDPMVRQIGLTQARLHELLAYDMNTGVFTWKVRRGGKATVGAVAGRLDTHGHRQITIDGVLYLAHRLAWLYVHGVWPTVQIDHRDTAKDNNRISNLRLATRSEQMRNRGPMATNTSGFKGVSWHKKSGKWRAQIWQNGTSRTIGHYATTEEAAAAYAAEAYEHHGEFARLAA
jgi:hypothetical protein